jgi:hypothetical protein
MGFSVSSVDVCGFAGPPTEEPNRLCGFACDQTEFYYARLVFHQQSHRFSAYIPQFGQLIDPIMALKRGLLG